MAFLSRFARPAAGLSPAVLASLAATPAIAQTQSAGDISVASAINAFVVGALIICLVAAVIYHRRRMARAMAESRALQDSLDQLDALLDVSFAQFYCWNLAGGREYGSPGLAPLIGYGAGSNLTFQNVKDIFSVADADRIDAAARGLRETGIEFDLPAVSRDGDRNFRLIGRVVSHDRGMPSVVVLWLEDASRLAADRDKLKDEINWLRRVIDFVPLPVWTRNSTLSLNYANLAYRDAVDADLSVPASKLGEIGTGVSGADGRDLARVSLDTGQPETALGHVVVGSERRLLEFSEQPLGDGETVAGYALDRTEQSEIRTELLRHMASHEEVLHKLGTAIAIYDADEHLKFFNTAFTQMWGLEDGWLRSNPTMGEVLEALRARQRLPEAADFPKYKAGQLSLFTSLINPVEELLHLPDGTTLRAIATPHPFGGLLMTWEDVTDALALERSFNTLSAVQRETLDHLYEGVAVIGADGLLQLSNPAFGRIWHLPEEELEAKPHASDLAQHMEAQFDGADRDNADLVGLLTGREAKSGRVERKDGTALDYATVPLPDGAVLLSYVDVTDSIQVERALRERNEALETADRLKSEFIANVSYELRTPLNTIIGFAEILTGQYFGSLNERQSEYSQGILDSSHRLLSLINDILDLASIEAGHMSLELDTVEIGEVVNSVVGLNRERIRQKKITFELDCPDEVGTFEADERRVKQALFNVLSNAVKFTPESGEIVLTVRRLDGEISFVCEDTGIGIPEEDRGRVFTKFERGNNPEARRGAGLGLSLVKSFTELHGGRVELDSEPGRGTRVTCVLPARSGAPEAERLTGTA